MKRYRMTLLSVLLKVLFCTGLIGCVQNISLSESTISDVDTISRFKISIAANAQQVWPILLQADRWRDSIEKLEAINLTAQQEGGVMAVYHLGSNNKPGILIKIQKIVLHKYYGFSIYSPSNEFVGFAAYALHENNGNTHLTYDVYVHSELINISDEGALVQKRKIISEMEIRQPKELTALKIMVEQ